MVIFHHEADLCWFVMLLLLKFKYIISVKTNVSLYTVCVQLKKYK